MTTAFAPELETKTTIGIAAVLPENFYAALQSVGTAIVNKPSLPIMANVALIAEKSGITLIASDCQNTQIVKIGAKVDIPFEITVPWRTLRDVMALANQSRIDIRVDMQTSIATFDQGNWKCNIKGMPYSDYPAVAQTNDNATLLAMVDYEKLIELANIGKRHAAKNDNRPVLQSARIRITPDALQYTTANGYTVFDATMSAETENSVNYEILVPAETLYKALTAAKKNPRLRDYVGLYGTRIDENGRVNGLFFIEDSPISATEGMNYPDTIFLDNATPVGKCYDTHSVYKAVWGYKKANRLEFRGYPGDRKSDIPEVNIAFITDGKNGESHCIDKGFTMLLDTYRFAILNGTVELAEYMRHAMKHGEECKISRGDNLIIFSHDHAGGYMRVAFVPHHTGEKISTESHKREHSHEKFSEVVEQTIPQTIETNAIRFEKSGFEYTGKRIVHYRLIEGEKAYTCQITGASETWSKIQRELSRRILPKVTIERPKYFKSEDFWRNAGISSTQMLIDAIQRLGFSFGLTDKMPEIVAQQFLNSDESLDYSDIWEYIDTPEAQNNSTDYEIEVFNADNDDMLLIALELADHNICGDDRDEIGCYLRHNRPNSIFVLPIEVCRTVEIINGLGFQTDEDPHTPDPSPDNDESPYQGDSPVEAQNIQIGHIVELADDYAEIYKQAHGYPLKGIVTEVSQYNEPIVQDALGKYWVGEHQWRVLGNVHYDYPITPELPPGTLVQIWNDCHYRVIECQFGLNRRQGCNSWVYLWHEKAQNTTYDSMGSIQRIISMGESPISNPKWRGKIETGNESTAKNNDHLREQVIAYFAERKNGVKVPAMQVWSRKEKYDMQYQFGLPDIMKVLPIEQSILHSILDELLADGTLQRHMYNQYSMLRPPEAENTTRMDSKMAQTKDYLLSFHRAPIDNEIGPQWEGLRISAASKKEAKNVAKAHAARMDWWVLNVILITPEYQAAVRATAHESMRVCQQLGHTYDSRQYELVCGKEG